MRLFTEILLLTLAILAGYVWGHVEGYHAGYKDGFEAPHETSILLRGTASWYGPGFHGRIAANGSVYNQHEMTAAHRSLPFGTKVRVINLKNGKSVLVTITDRGPYIGDRVIDMSYASASALGMVKDGIAKVEVRVVT